MSKLEMKLSEYEKFHIHSHNKTLHWIGIPFILISILGLLGHVVFWSRENSIFQFDLALCIIGLATIRYVRLHLEIAFAFLPVLVGCYFLGRSIPMPALWILFGIGWGFQLVGHHLFEKNSPAFTQNSDHLLVAPLWLFSSLIGWKFVDRSRAHH